LLVILVVHRLGLAIAVAKPPSAPESLTEYRDEIYQLVESRRLQEAIDKIDYGVKSGTLQNSNLRLIRCWILLLDLQLKPASICVDEYSKLPHIPDPDLLINYNKVISKLHFVQEVLDADRRKEYDKVLRLIAEDDGKAFWRLESYRAKAAEQVLKAHAAVVAIPARTVPFWRSRKFWFPTALGGAVMLGLGLTLGLLPRPYHEVSWQNP
jgi:hypothetical protein